MGGFGHCSNPWVTNFPTSIDPGRRRLVQAMLGSALLAGCGQQAGPPLRIGINEFPSYELLHLASEKGFFREQGVEVQVVEFSSLADTIVALRNRQIDGAATTLVDFLVAHERDGVDTRVVHVLDYSVGADVILGRPGTNGISGLRGRRIAAENDSLGLFVLGRALQLSGMLLGDVKLVGMDQASGEQAFVAGQVDAFVTYPPISTRLKARNDVSELWNSRAIPGEILDIIAVSEPMLRTRGKDVARMLPGIGRAHAYLMESPADAIAIMAKRERIAPEVFARALREEMKLIAPMEQRGYLQPGAVVHRQLELAADFLLGAGVLKRRPDIAGLYLEPARIGADHGG